MTKPTTQTDWQKEFEIDEGGRVTYPFIVSMEFDHLKEIIANERKLVLEEVRALVEGMKKVCGGDYQMNDEYEQCHGYNQALDDLKATIEKLEDK